MRLSPSYQTFSVSRVTVNASFTSSTADSMPLDLGLQVGATLGALALAGVTFYAVSFSEMKKARPSSPAALERLWRPDSQRRTQPRALLMKSSPRVPYQIADEAYDSAARRNEVVDSAGAPPQLRSSQGRRERRNQKG